MPHDDLKFPWEEELPPTRGSKDTAAAATRGATSTAIPALIRVGSGFGSGMGGLMGAGVSGAGEIIAQLIENGGDPRDINVKRVLLEAGIGAVPGAKLIKVGSPLKSAALGATAATAGVAGRKLTADNPEERKIDPVSDLLQIGIGGGAGYAVGKFADRALAKKNGLPIGKGTARPDERPATYKQADKPHGPDAPMNKDFKAQAHWTPERVEELAQRYEVAGKPEVAQSIREAGVSAGKDDPIIRGKILSGRKTEAREAEKGWTQEARNEKSRESWRQKGIEQEAKNQKLRDKYIRTMDKDRAAADAENTARTAVAAAKADLEPQAPVVAETASFADEAGKSSVTQKWTTPVEEGGAPAARPLPNRITPDERKGLAAMTPERAAQMLNRDLDGMVKSGELIKEGPNYRINPDYGKKSKATTPAGGALPEQRVEPKPGVYQIVRPDGKTVTAADEATAEALVNSFGRGSIVVPPSDLPKAPAAPRQKPVKGTAGQVTEELDKKAAAAPVDSSRGSALAASEDATTQLEEVMELTGGAGAKSVKGMGEMPAEAAAPVMAQPTGAKLSAPLAIQVAQAQQDVPAGSVIARFFKDQNAANKGAAYAEEVPDNLLGMLTSLLGRAEVTPRAPKGAASDPRGALWGMISKLQNEQNLPQFPRGSTVKPSLKHAKNPDGTPYTPPPAAVPVIDAAIPPAGKPTKGKATKTEKAGKAATAPAAVAPIAPQPPAAPEPPKAPPVAQEPVVSDTLDPNFIKVTPGESILPPSTMPAPRPVPPQLQARIDAAKKEMQILQNAKQGDSPAAQTLGKEIEELQQQLFAAQYPELVAELAQAEQAAKATPKGRKGRAKDETGAASLGGVMDIAGALGGGLAGGALYDQDPLLGALVGAAAGYGGSRGLASLAESDKPFISIDASDPKGSIARLLAGFQRFNYLTDPTGLGINTMLAPPGAGIMGSLERMAVGKAEQLTGADPNATAKMESGADALRTLLSQRGLLSGDNWKQAWDDAESLIGNAERAEELPEETLDMLRELFAAPGRVMTTGDVVVRRSLMQAGIPENIAKAITVTSNPRYDIGELIVNFAKRPVGSLLLPFSRTAANILEGGLERTPIVGLLLDKTNDPAIKATFTEMVTRQGLGAGMWYLGFLAGRNVNPEVDEKMQIRKIITNMSGQYGLPVAAGFAAGQAVQVGKMDGNLGDLIKSAGTSYASDFPLPTTRAMSDMTTSISNYLDGQPAHPNAEELSRQWLPSSLTPGIVPAVERMFRQAQEPDALKFPWE